MLGILFFVISVAVFGVVTFFLVEFLAAMVLEYRICVFSLGVAQDHLMDNGRGYFRDKTYEAVMIEAQIRSFLTILVYVILFALVLFLLPSAWSFWVVPRWSIKIGVALGILVNGLGSFLISAKTRTQVGRLERIDSDGVAYFKGLWGSDFSFDVGKYWEPEDYPPVGWKFMMLKYNLFGGLAPLELNDGDDETWKNPES